MVAGRSPQSIEERAQAVRLTPLVAIDFIVRDAEGYALLGLRSNAPAKAFYFVLGGSIRKDERIADAFGRILKAETGLDRTITQARFLGVYEHLYPDNTFGDPGYGTHYVVLGYELRLAERPLIVLDQQHSSIRWMQDADIARAPDVHPNAQAYFLVSSQRPG